MKINLLQVIPISCSYGSDTLSYWTSKEVDPGALVSVPVGKKKVTGVVLSSQNANDEKTDIKSQSFKMKKIDSVVNPSLLTKFFLEAVQETARHFVSPMGVFLSSIVPAAFLDESVKDSTSSNSGPAKTSMPIRDTYVLQSDEDERYAHYKSLIREEFAKGRSVFFCLPTIEDIRKTFETLPRGIESYTHVLHSDLSSKELCQIRRNILEEDHPILIIATGSFLSIPRYDIGTIIIEKESSRAYKKENRPFIDIRTFAHNYAKIAHKRLVFGDTVLRAETLYRHKSGEFPELAPLKFRFLTTAETELISMNSKVVEEGDESEKLKGKDNENKRKTFKLLSDELVKLISDTKEENDHLFIFAARRGLSPSTSCGDCGTLVACVTCGTPMVLHKGSQANRNVFICHKCGEKKKATVNCEICGSWNLVPLGIGAARVEEEITSLFPDTKIFKIDSDNTKTTKRVRDELKKFLSTPGSVLIGTEKALLYLPKDTIANTAVVSLDSLFSLPDFRINERVLHLLLAMRERATKRFLVQTRMENQPILKQGLQGDLMGFYRSEIKEREQFDYPPFTMLVRLTLSGERAKVTKEIEKLSEKLSEWETVAFPAFGKVGGKKYTMHFLIKLPRKDWPDEKLLASLFSLPPTFEINVDPESIL